MSTKILTVLRQDCARCIDSFLSLKDLIVKQDDMELVKGNKRKSDKSDDEESVT
jgi:hypothetical protein